ncbi:hypothetical protein [Mucilaginibacter gilvus]|nr:hypothetical protein [Mucilaginibacter gilvus]
MKKSLLSIFIVIAAVLSTSPTSAQSKLSLDDLFFIHKTTDTVEINNFIESKGYKYFFSWGNSNGKFTSWDGKKIGGYDDLKIWRIVLLDQISIVYCIASYDSYKELITSARKNNYKHVGEELIKISPNEQALCDVFKNNEMIFYTHRHEYANHNEYEIVIK